jgi:hypothetical protein
MRHGSSSCRPAEDIERLGVSFVLVASSVLSMEFGVQHERTGRMKFTSIYRVPSFDESNLYESDLWFQARAKIILNH